MGVPLWSYQKDAVKPNQSILIADDLIATGGAAVAATAANRGVEWQGCWFCICDRVGFDEWSR